MLRILIVTLLTISSAIPVFSQTSPTQTATRDSTKRGLPERILGTRLSPTIDIRGIDGILLGLSYKLQTEKLPNGSPGNFQKITALHSLTTRAFVVGYGAEFKNVFNKTDLTINGLADMQGNLMNFFGPGNDTEFDQTGDFSKFYRVNFSFYEFRPALRFRLSDELSITTGPSIQYFVDGSNVGRYFNTANISSSYTDLYGDKLHGGLVMDFNWDRRDDKILPSRGVNFNLVLQGFDGLNASSQSFAQVFSQFSFYKSLNANGTIVIANRLGGVLTSGNPAFYQSAFLGSQDNLLGFRKNRFAGDHVLYNNLETRITIPNFLMKLIPGKIGFIGAYDAGRVWVKNEPSNTIHHGLSAGAFATPFNRFFVRGTMGFSKERLQPVVSFRQRF